MLFLVGRLNTVCCNNIYSIQHKTDQCDNNWSGWLSLRQYRERDKSGWITELKVSAKIMTFTLWGIYAYHESLGLTRCSVDQVGPWYMMCSRKQGFINNVFSILGYFLYCIWCVKQGETFLMRIAQLWYYRIMWDMAIFRTVSAISQNLQPYLIFRRVNRTLFQ